MSGVQQAAVFQHRLDAGLLAAPCSVHFSQVFGIPAGKNHLAEAVAIGASEAAVIFEPLIRVIVEHFSPKIRVIAGGIAETPDVAEIAGAVARRNGGDP